MLSSRKPDIETIHLLLVLCPGLLRRLLNHYESRSEGVPEVRGPGPVGRAN